LVFGELTNGNPMVEDARSVHQIVADVIEANNPALGIVTVNKEMHRRLVLQKSGSKLQPEITAFLATWFLKGGQLEVRDPGTRRAPPAGGTLFDLQQRRRQAAAEGHTEFFLRGEQLEIGGPGGQATDTLRRTAAKVELGTQMLALATPPGMTYIPVFRAFAEFLCNLNSALQCIDTMLQPRGRTVFAEPKVIREIIHETILAHAPEVGRREDYMAIIRHLCPAEEGEEAAGEAPE
jgi:hypothetical protein